VNLLRNNGSNFYYTDDNDDDFAEDNVTEETSLINPVSASVSHSESN